MRVGWVGRKPAEKRGVKGKALMGGWVGKRSFAGGWGKRDKLKAVGQRHRETKQDNLACQN